MQNKRFQKRIENFECSRCSRANIGHGYTDHCAYCLWSKHVDINPGDRASSCRGMMEPIGVEKKGDSYSIVYRCTKCGIKKKNKAAPEDDFDEMIKLSERLNGLT